MNFFIIILNSQFYELFILYFIFLYIIFKFQLLYKEITKKIIYLIFIILLTRVLSMQHLILHANVLN